MGRPAALLSPKTAVGGCDLQKRSRARHRWRRCQAVAQLSPLLLLSQGLERTTLDCLELTRSRTVLPWCQVTPRTSAESPRNML